MVTNSLEIKDKTNYDLDDVSYIGDFDVNSLEITKKESRIGANIYYTRCVLNLDEEIIIPLHFRINRLIRFIEEIDGLNDKYLVVASSLRNKNIIDALNMVWSSIGDKINPGIKIKDYDKFRFNSDIALPVNTIIEFRSLLINVSCVIETDNEYYPEIYLEECSTHNEGKSVVAERFIRKLKGKIYKYMTSISKNVYINKLDDIVDEYNNTYHTTIKMKPIDIKDNTYINASKDINNKDPKFQVIDHVRISKYKNIFAEGYMPNWSEEVFVIKKVKNTIPWTYVINDLNGKEIIGTFYEKELQKTNQEKFRIEKVIRRKGNKLYVKWKGYDNSFNSWIDKKDIIK